MGKKTNQYLIFYLRVSITLPYDQRCVVGGGGIELDDEGIATRATASIRILRLWNITVRELDNVWAGFSYRERMFEMPSDCILVQ